MKLFTHLDPFPAEIRFALFQNEQVCKGQEKRVTGNIESLPTKTVLEAVCLAKKFCDIADARIVFNGKEKTGGKVPYACGHD